MSFEDAIREAPAEPPAAPSSNGEPPAVPDPASTRHAAAWAEHAESLADWTLRHLAVCRDCYGTYYRKGDKFKSTTTKEPVTRELLIRHYSGRITIGLHAISADNQCSWIGADIDAHDDKADPGLNLRCAIAAAKFLYGFKLVAIVCDSNGKGGYHVRVFFKKPVPAAAARWLCERLEAHLQAEGFPPFETFPKQDGVEPRTRYGNWLRLPGKHAKRDHWTRIMGSAPGEWLEGHAAVKRLLAIGGDDPKDLLDAYRKACPAPPRPTPRAADAPADGTPDGIPFKPTAETVRAALEHLPNEDVHYDDWLDVGISLNDWDQDEGLAIWIAWSEDSAKHVPGVCEEKWPSFTPGGKRTIRTLFYEAERNGWPKNPYRRPPLDDDDCSVSLGGRAGHPDEPPPVPPANGRPRDAKGRRPAPEANGQPDGPKAETAAEQTADRADRAAEPDPDLDAELAHRPRTEMGNSERFVARFGHQAKYVAKWDKWVVWDGKRWVLDSKDAHVLRLAKDAARMIIAEAATFRDSEQQKEHFSWAMKSQKRSVVSASIYLARPDVMIQHELLDQHPYLLNCVNGTIDLRSGELLGHDPRHLITQLCPTIYDSTATCPNFLRFLNEIFAGDHREGLVAFMRRWFGYSLTGVCIEQKMPFWFGEGNNGKSTLIGVLQKVLGLDYAMEATRDLLIERHHPDHLTTIADLFRKRLVAIVETTDDQLNLAQFKHLTGEDRIRARRMREDTWEFAPTHKLIMATNKRPSIPDGGHAEWRRILSVPFDVIIPSEKIDKDLGRKLEREAAGILRWGVEGCLEWQRLGLQPPDVITASTERYRESQDSLDPFFREVCARRLHLGAALKIRTAALREAYVRWCERQDRDILKPRQFDQAMEKKGFPIQRNNGSWFYGIGLRDANRELAKEDDSNG